MNRREFGKTLGAITAVSAVTSNIGAQGISSVSPEPVAEREYLSIIGWNPEQIAAWMRMRQFEPEGTRSIFPSRAGTTTYRTGAWQPFLVTWRCKDIGTSRELRRF